MTYLVKKFDFFTLLTTFQLVIAVMKVKAGPWVPRIARKTSNRYEVAQILTFDRQNVKKLQKMKIFTNLTNIIKGHSGHRHKKYLKLTLCWTFLFFTCKRAKLNCHFYEYFCFWLEQPWSTQPLKILPLLLNYISGKVTKFQITVMNTFLVATKKP